uniref:Elongation factor P n=1 Tax=Anthurium amnicola TaxID=1678845 RepID=A0A1D1XU02_9ARAE
MHAVRRRLLVALFYSSPSSPSPPSSSSSSFSSWGARSLEYYRAVLRPSPDDSGGTLASPWSALQRRGAKVLGSDVRLGNMIQRKGRIFQVLKAQHTQHGRGGATIQVELRDVDTGNKVTERFRTDEAIERVFVEEKSFTFLYKEGDSVMVMEPSTFEQLELPKDFFGKNAAYLKDNMTVTVQYYDGKPMSASVPQRVTCKVVEAPPYSKGMTATPQYKRVSLDNGLTVLAPSHITPGDEIVVNTMDDSYITRAKE